MEYTERREKTTESVRLKMGVSWGSCREENYAKKRKKVGWICTSDARYTAVERTRYRKERCR